MKLSPFSTKSLVATAALVAAVGTSVGISGGARASSLGNLPASWLPAPLRLVGVWDVSVTLRDCVSGQALASFPAMNQYAADGSQLEFGVNMPPATRYPSLGTWRFAGLHKYVSAFRFFRFNPDGSYAGTQEVSRTITLSNDANQFSTVAHVAIYNPAHQLMKSGCATEAGARR